MHRLQRSEQLEEGEAPHRQDKHLHGQGQRHTLVEAHFRHQGEHQKVRSPYRRINLVQNLQPRTALALLTTTTGLLVAIWAVHIFTRLTMIDPFTTRLTGHRACALGIAVSHHIVLLYSVARAARTMSVRGGLAAGGAGVALLGALWLLPPVNGMNFSDTLRITVGQQAWWFTLALAGLVTALSRIVPARPLHWTRLWLGAGAVWLLGMVVYFSITENQWLLMVGKITCVLIIPSVALATTAMDYRGYQEGPVRALALAGASLSVAAATIH